MRALTPGAIAGLSGPAVALAVLVDMAFDSPLRMASGSAAIDVGGVLYFGAGNLGSVDAVRDEAGQTQGLKFALSGVPSVNIALALGLDVQGRACTVRVALCDPATWAVLDTPVAWTGTLDQMPISHGAETATIGVVAMHRGETFRRPKPLRYTDGDQQRLVPGDTSCQYIVSQSQHQDVWPAAAWGRQ